MTATSTATPDLATMLTQAERAQAEANAAASRAAEAQAQAVAVGNRIAAERDTRFVAWAEATIAAAPATEATLAADVDTARRSFEVAVSDGEPTFVSLYLSWSESAARLHHYRGHIMSVRGNLHHRRPAEHPAPDTSRSITDSRSSIPAFNDALDRAVAMAAAALGGDAEDALQDTLSRALRGEDIPAPDRRDG